MFPEEALGEPPFICRYMLLFQYAVYPVHCRCLSSLDTVSVPGIILHHLVCAYLAFPVYLPEDDSPVTGNSKTVLFQQPLQYFFCLAAVIENKKRGNEAEENTLWEYDDIRSRFRGYTCLQTDAKAYRFHPHRM